MSVEGAERRWFGDGDQIDKWRQRSNSGQTWSAALLERAPRPGSGRAEVEPYGRRCRAQGGKGKRARRAGSRFSSARGRENGSKSGQASSQKALTLARSEAPGHVSELCAWPLGTR